MPKMRHDTKRFRDRALGSLLLAIELFNRPHDVGRTEGVLILLQHAFEMLLKGAIYQDRGVICDKKDGNAYGFDRCLRIAQSDLHILSDDEVITLAILDGCRDCAMHNLLDLPETALYLHSQAAVTLFDDVMVRVFGERLGDHLPSRVLPISTAPPQDMSIFLDSEFTQIRELLSPRRRRRAEAKARLRHLMIIEGNLEGNRHQPMEKDVERLVRQIRNDLPLSSLFPNSTTLHLDTEGHGLSFTVRFTKLASAPPVRIVREGEDGVEEATVIREVNLLDRFSMGTKDIAKKLGLTEPKTRALIHHLNLQADEECFRQITVSKSRYKRYSPKALTKLGEALPNVDIEDVWREYWASLKA